MNKKQINSAIIIGCTVIVAVGVRDMINIHAVERAKRKQILDDMGLDVAAIHNATDIVNGRIERGEIRSYNELRDAVLTEIAFQKITIREEFIN